VATGFLLWVIANAPAGYKGRIGYNTLFVIIASFILLPLLVLAPGLVPRVRHLVTHYCQHLGLEQCVSPPTGIEEKTPAPRF